MVLEYGRGVRLRVLVPLTLTFIVLIGIFIFTGYNIRQRSLHHASEHRYKGVTSLFNELQKQRLALMTATIQYVSHQPELQRAMLRKDRQSLLSLAQPIFSEINTLHGITHLYFFDVDRINVLRVQRPEDYGDQVNRLSLKKAQERRELAFGLELGDLGIYSLRVVVPWFSANNQLLGYIELGEEIDSILQTLKKVTNTDFIVSIDKKFLDQRSWEKGMRLMHRPANWDLLETRAIINQTIDEVPHSVEKQIFWDYGDIDHFHTESSQGESYQSKAFPLMDIAQNRLGDFVMLINISKEHSMFINFMLRTGLFTLVVCSALFFFAFRTLGRVDNAMNTAREDLYSQIDKAEVLNSKLIVEIAERKRAEHELTLLNINLEKRIMERTQKLETLNSEIELNRRELQKAYEDLKINQTTILHQDKMASIGLLAAGVAHDINNPIGFVSNNLSELSQYIKDLCQFMSLQCKVLDQLNPNEEQLAMLSDLRNELQLDHLAEDLDDIITESLEGTRRVSKIVQNLRKFSRGGEDESELTDIHECLESTISISSNELRYKAEVIRDYGELPQVLCYPSQLNQVFMNLIINAAHAMHNYGKITVKTWAQSESVFIKFTDTGAGIPAEIQDRIFEPFFTTKDVGTGTGLGLSITYDIIQRHEGDIWVESENGKGTSFVVRLPAKRHEES